MIPKIGLDEKNREGVINVLNTVLADEQVLYTKLRKYHWNITGAQFFSLHDLFEQQYNQIKATADKIAEWARALGGPAIGTLEEFQERARLDEQPGEYPSARDMVIDLVRVHEKMARNLREDARICAEEYKDVGTEDLLIGVLQKHIDMAWMLRSFVEGQPVHASGDVAAVGGQ